MNNLKEIAFRMEVHITYSVCSCCITIQNCVPIWTREKSPPIPIPTFGYLFITYGFNSSLNLWLDIRTNWLYLQFRSLFAANTHLNVTFHLWDMYFQLGDQFLVFFMSLILVFNIREEIMSSQDMEKPELMSKRKSSLFQASI